MGLHIDSMPDDETIQAAMYGPLVLAGKFDAVSKDMTYGGMGPKRDMQGKVPEVKADSAHSTSWMELDPKRPLNFRAQGQSEAFDLVPLNRVLHERYAVYWKVRPS